MLEHTGELHDQTWVAALGPTVCGACRAAALCSVVAGTRALLTHGASNATGAGSIGQLEFFYDQAPDVMRSCSMALQLLSVCIGTYLSGALVLGVAQGTAALDPGGAGWLPGDLNDGRLDLFFLLLAGARLDAGSESK